MKNVGKAHILLLLAITLVGLWALPAKCQLPASHIVVSCFLDEVMTVIDARAIRIVKTMPVAQISDLAISPADDFLVASIFNRDYMMVYKLPGLNIGPSARGDYLKSVKAMEFSGDGARLYILGASSLYEVHVPSFKLIRTLPLQFFKPESMVMSKDKTKMYIAHPEMGAVSIIDLVQWQYCGDIRFKNPISALALNKDDSKLAVICPNEHALKIFDAASITEIASSPVEQGACQVRINNDNVAIVLNSVSNSISIINIDNTLDRRILAVGIGPRDVLLMPNGQGCYVANYTSGDMSVIDLNTIRQLGRLYVGRGARCLRWMK